MVRAVFVKALVALWMWGAFRFLPVAIAWPCAALSLVTGVLFLVQAVMRPSSQFFVKVLARGPREARVALTFDDGPDPEVTPRVLALLREHAARATFFVVGERAEKYPDLVRQIVREGHELGTHTYSHRVKFHFGSASYVYREIQRGIDVVRQISGKEPRFFRPPQGLRTPFSSRVLRRYQNLVVVTWTERAMDSLRTTAERIVSRLAPSLVPGAILTMHDGKGYHGGNDREPTLQALGDILTRCKERGLACTTLSEMTGRSARIEPVLYTRSEYGTPLDRLRYPRKYRWPFVLYAPLRVARALGVLSAFALFWFGSILFAWLALPIAWLFGGTHLERLRRNHRMLRACFYAFHAYMRGLRMFDSRAAASLPLRPEGSARGRVLVANHTTLVDMTAIVSLYPNVVCVAKSGYVENIWMGRLLRACGFISAGGGAAGHQSMLEQCEAMLELGYDVLVFPEGTRSVPGSLHPFRRGAFEVACRSKVDVILLEMHADPPALSKGLPFWHHPDVRVIHSVRPMQVVNPAMFGYKSRTMCREIELIFRKRLGLDVPTEHVTLSRASEVSS